MNSISDLLPQLLSLVPFVLVSAALVAALFAADWILLKRLQGDGRPRVWQQITMVLLTLAAIALAVLALPVSDTMRAQLIALLGALVTAALAFSSTNLIANAMAGLMLRSVSAFRPGDFVRAGSHFGRVSERGLFHIEIQTPDRDLTTLPNTYLITNPVSVVRASGTIVSAYVSLGYDEPHSKISALLELAAVESGLEKPFVHVEDLGDYSVSYRVAGFLSDVKNLLSARSALRIAMLDTLHEAGVEIVSPAFMNQRPIPTGHPVMPEGGVAAPRVASNDSAEEVMFDKADLAGRLAQLRSDREELQREISELEKAGGNSGAAIARKQRQLHILDALIARESELLPE